MRRTGEIADIFNTFGEILLVSTEIIKFHFLFLFWRITENMSFQKTFFLSFLVNFA